MHLVVGLGNPGERYAGTRHNVGYEVVGRLAGGAVFGKSRCQAELATIAHPHPARLARPTTYMNVSGKAVRALVDYYDVPLDELLVVCDDLDLPLGVIRIRRGGGSGGQNGLRSIALQLGTQEFPRLRIGIDRSPRVDPADYVLSPWSAEQRAAIEPVLERAVQAVECWLAEGIEPAMNRYNG